VAGTEFQGSDQVLVPAARIPSLETRDESLDRSIPLPFEPVTDSTARLVGLVQLFPDGSFPAGFHDSVVDRVPANGEDRDGLQVGIICGGDSPGQQIETVSERLFSDVGAAGLEDVEGVEPESLFRPGLEA
jgi:hypothetical protein